MPPGVKTLSQIDPVYYAQASQATSAFRVQISQRQLICTYLT